MSAPNYSQGGALIDRLTTAPLLSSPDAARARLSDLLDSAEGEPLREIATGSAASNLLLGIADHSPYLWGLIRTDPARTAALLRSDPQLRLDICLKEMRAACALAANREDALHALRKAKQTVALLVAMADLGGAWGLSEVTGALTHYADAAVSSALTFVLLEAARAGALNLRDKEHAERGCGLAVLALGKQGAVELNYSSDVDLVVFFDPRSAAIPEDVEPRTLYVRLTQALARLLQERTGDGYALRVDLRLRPDPGSTAVAIALPAALDYYERLGQNWERAAMIKARPVAGDLTLGATFVHGLAPFIWRKYFDYAAIADVHAMKRQIHAVRGHATIAVAGHDVKLGRGGIREIEFFVQTQQLIFGGRRPELRGSRTLNMLKALETDGWISPDATRELSAAYVFLREIEHRLQMVADEQTQRLPSDPTQLEDFARYCGFADAREFGDALVGHLSRVEWHYARLFEHAPMLDAPIGALVFTGVGDDPETIETLRRLGFANPERAAETVRGWHFGRRSAVQSARAREVLTELVPALLQSFATSGDPDAGLAAFDAALARMPAAVELFSILRSNKDVRDLFADILGGAPRLANEVTLRPHLLDGAIDPALLRAGVGEAAYETRVGNLLANAETTEDFLDGLRDLQHEEAFLIGVRALSGMLDVASAGLAFTALAESVTRAALFRVEQDFARDHSRVDQGRCAILAFGRLGAGEMTATSDLDLVLVYDFDEARPQSDGARPLHAVQYYTRLTQRLVAALTVATRRGRLYAVDLRLRPSGGKGPLATQFRSFLSYQKEQAETWEHMSLCHARVIAGDDDLGKRVEQARADILSISRNQSQVKGDVLAMRRLVAREKGDKDVWDLKLVSGGLLDIEFIAQFLILSHAHNHPAIMRVETVAALEAAQASGALGLDDARDLIEAHRLYSAVMQMSRLTSGLRFRPKEATAGVLRRIAAAAELPDFARLESELSRNRSSVRAIFAQILGESDAQPPAEAPNHITPNPAATSP